jgi:hypothetical protein
MSSRDSTSYHIMVLFSSEGYPAQDHNISTKYAKYELLLWIATDCVPRTEVLSVLYNNRCFCCSRSLGYVSVSISLSLQRFWHNSFVSHLFETGGSISIQKVACHILEIAIHFLCASMNPRRLQDCDEFISNCLVFRYSLGWGNAVSRVWCQFNIVIYFSVG